MNIITVPISKVVPWDKNPRGILKADFERLKKQIRKLGVYKPLVAYKENGKYIVLGGNMRIRALQELRLKEVEVSVVKAETEKEKIEFSLSDNDRAGYYEEEELAELVYPYLDEIKLEDFKVDLGEAIDLKQVVERYGPDIDDGADEVPEIDDTPAITKMGDLFTLGKHRLMCGDSTKAEDVARLMRGEKKYSIFTDPPYGVDYNYESWDDKDAGKNDELYARINSFSVPLVYFCGSVNLLREMQRGQCKILIWHKPWAMTHSGIGNGKHHWEPVITRRLPKGAYIITDVLVVNTDRIPDLRDKHSCPKPVGLMTTLIQSLSPNGGILDPFLGSGTTLIAAEKLNRICYGMEIDPKYCDVIIKRYADYMGMSEESIRATRERAGKR